MRTILRIKEIGLNKLNNAEFTYFAQSFLHLIHNVKEGDQPGTGVSLGMDPEDVKQFEADSAIMRDILWKRRTSKLTAKMAEVDKSRIKHMIFINKIVRTNQKSSIDAYRQAAISLYTVLKPYIGCQRMGKTQLTATLNSYITDLNKPENIASLTALSLSGELEMLETDNDTYATLSAQRADEQARNKLEQGKKVRARMYDFYDYMTAIVYTKNLMEPSETLIRFIECLNALISDITTRHNQRMGQLKRYAEKRKQNLG